MTPTSRTLKHFRDAGWLAEVVERWIPRVNIRRDFAGCIDIICYGDKGILGIQATSTANVAARVAKSLAEPRLVTWLAAGGRFYVIGWALRGPRGGRKRWTPKCVEISRGEGGQLTTQTVELT